MDRKTKLIKIVAGIVLMLYGIYLMIKLADWLFIIIIVMSVLFITILVLLFNRKRTNKVMQKNSIIDDSKYAGDRIIKSPECKQEVNEKITSLPLVTEPAKGTSKQSMIQCAQCNTMNQNRQTRCSQCGANLLPGFPKEQRITFLGVALFFLILGVVSGWFATSGGFATNGAPPPSLPYNLPSPNSFCACFSIIGLIGFFSSLWRAIGPTPLAAKYAFRAERNEGVNNSCAESDYGEAIQLAPRSAYYRYKRSLFYEKLGRLEEAHRDLLEALELERKEKGGNVTRSEIKKTLKRIEQTAEWTTDPKDNVIQEIDEAITRIRHIRLPTKQIEQNNVDEARTTPAATVSIDKKQMPKWEKRTKQRKCLTCGQLINEGVVVCPFCGNTEWDQVTISAILGTICIALAIGADLLWRIRILDAICVIPGLFFFIMYFSFIMERHKILKRLGSESSPVPKQRECKDNLRIDEKDSISTRLRNAESLGRAGEFEQATYELEQALEYKHRWATNVAGALLDKEPVSGYALLIVLAGRAGKKELALKYFMRTLELNPKQPGLAQQAAISAGISKEAQDICERGEFKWIV